MTEKDGGPAFPILTNSGHKIDGDGHMAQEFHGHSGMTLRDWFAGQVLPGIANRSADFQNYEYHAATAYAYADAMLKERTK